MLLRWKYSHQFPWNKGKTSLTSLRLIFASFHLSTEANPILEGKLTTLWMTFNTLSNLNSVLREGPKEVKLNST